MEIYKLEMTTKELLDLLSKYYTNLLNKPITVKETHRIVYGDYYECDSVAVDIYFEETIELLGVTGTKTTKLTKNDIEEVLNELLKERGYRISYLRYKTEINSGDYSSLKNTVFSGIEVELKEIQKELKKKM